MSKFRKPKNYAKEGKYFDNTNEILLHNSEEIENSKKYFSWAQGFSKKIVVIIFCLYVGISLFSLGLVWLTYQEGSVIGIDVLIEQTNETLRNIVGGYIVKAAAENSFKIIGNYFVGIANAKLKAIEYQMKKNDTIDDNDEIVSDNEDVDEETV